MATFALIHGGGGGPWDWHLLVPELEALGHRAVPVDLPCASESALLADYVDAVVRDVGDPVPDLVVVGHSLGGLTAPLVATRVPVALCVFVAGMVPAPGETGGQWWGDTGHRQADPDDDELATFFNDVPAGLAAEAFEHVRPQGGAVMGDPWPLPALPDVPMRFLLCTRDRFFPPEFLRGVVADRLGIEPDELDAGHCPALSRPRELAARLDAYWAALDPAVAGSN